MEWLNYHHLYYFWVAAQEGSVKKASKKLRISQSTISGLIKKLEFQFDQPLFEREFRGIKLTEAGQAALEYADHIFSSGQELVSILKNRPSEKIPILFKVGAIGSLSKNLQYSFVKSLLEDDKVKLKIVQGPLSQLLSQLQQHLLDVVISNIPARTDEVKGVYNHSLGKNNVSIVGGPKFKNLLKKFPDSIAGIPLFVPTFDSHVRSELELYFEQQNLKPLIKAEVEDVALLRLLALSEKGLAIVPEIGVKTELENGKLIVIHRFKNVAETFYAISRSRRFPNLILQKLIGNFDIGRK